MPRPLHATIDLACMQHNLGVARACAPGAKLWAVVKANAYGHGLERALRGFAGADGLALIELDNAVRLRALGWTKPILLLEGVFEARDLPLLWQYDLACVVHTEEQLALLEATPLPHPVAVHLKMNTGMNRLGFAPSAFRAAHARLAAIPGIAAISLMSHFANADAADHPLLPMREQLRRFLLATDGLPGERSLCNSGGILQRAPDLAQDWTRPGIMLYGASPDAVSAEAHGLQPCMTLSSKIIGVQQLAMGEAVGYGSRFCAAQPMRIGVVACGYADGYPRHAPYGTPVLVDGQRVALVGRVSMDMLTVDLGSLPHAGVGSDVVLWGKGLPIDEVAQAAGTIGYELMCAVAGRVPLHDA